MDVTTATRRQQLTISTGTLTSPPSLHPPRLPTLPFDLIPEILCRLPVKLLLQLKCLCKSLNSLISDPKFAKKHLLMSTAFHDHHHLIVASSDTSGELLLWDSPISSIFSKVSSTSTVSQLQLMRPQASLNNGCFVSSCDGILLFERSLLLWNPSIRKFKFLPPLLKPRVIHTKRAVYSYSFGYDHFIDNYKIFANCSIYDSYDSEVDVNQWKNEFSVYTLGYDSWRRIDDIPCDCSINALGIFVSGTVNWLACDASGVNFPAFYSGSFLLVIVSLDLEKESYRKLLMPDLIKSRPFLGAPTLGVLMNCLCFFTNSDEFLDVWVMKEYGIKESWTTMFSVPSVGEGPRSFYDSKFVYVSEDDLVLLDCKDLLGWKLVVYNSINGTFKILNIQNINCWMVPEVYVESLISPCS